ncbi:MAG: hypothetical protein R3F20_05035 [Planctomycetota bacterium]
MNYGVQVLGHPLIAELVETRFVPVIVKNNTANDAFAKLRASFEEPSWNNPVVRIIEADRKAVVPRLYGDWSLGRLSEVLAVALRARGEAVPFWLDDLRAETRAARRGWREAVFGMS